MQKYGITLLYGNLSANQPATFTNGSVIYQNLTIKGFGVDHWLSGISAGNIRLQYQEIIDGLYTNTIHFRKSCSISMTDFLVTNGPAVIKPFGKMLSKKIFY